MDGVEMYRQTAAGTCQPRDSRGFETVQFFWIGRTYASEFIAVKTILIVASEKIQNDFNLQYQTSNNQRGHCQLPCCRRYAICSWGLFFIVSSLISKSRSSQCNLKIYSIINSNLQIWKVVNQRSFGICNSKLNLLAKRWYNIKIQKRANQEEAVDEYVKVGSHAEAARICVYPEGELLDNCLSF